MKYLHCYDYPIPSIINNDNINCSKDIEIVLKLFYSLDLTFYYGRNKYNRTFNLELGQIYI